MAYVTKLRNCARCGKRPATVMVCTDSGVPLGLYCGMCGIAALHRELANEHERRATPRRAAPS
jgi:hypothetical protein